MIYYKIKFKKDLPEYAEHDGWHDSCLEEWAGKTFIGRKRQGYENWFEFFASNTDRGDPYNASVNWLENIVELP
jgi:hypothetical protein